MKTVKTSSNPGSNKRYRILRGHKHLYLALLPALSLAPFATMTAKADTNAPVTGEFVENNIPITAPAGIYGVS